MGKNRSALLNAGITLTALRLPRRNCDFQGGKMNSYCKYLVILCAVVAVFPCSVSAVDTAIELNVNADDVEGRVDVKLRPLEMPLTVGGGFIYSNDNEKYWLVNANAAVKDQIFTPALSLGVGLKGVFGTTDFPTQSVDTAATPFLFLADYDFRKMSLDWPISFAATFGYAPEIISFKDTERYIDFYLNGYFHINNFAALYVGYRRIDIDYEKSSIKYDLDDKSVYFGVRMSF